MAGIVCIETEWQITKKSNRLTLNTEPLLKFINDMYDIPYIYRRVATRDELKYYLTQFRKKEYSKYDVFYFSFHGNTHAISLEGEIEDITLSELLKIGGDVFNDRFIHFSSCRTLLGSDTITQKFKQESGAKVVSGYTKSVASDLSAIHDVAMFGELYKYEKIACAFNSLEDKYGGLEKELGFKYF